MIRSRAAGLIGLVALGCAALGAQETAASTAFLLSAPTTGTGVPVLPANTRRYALGRYALSDQPIEVYLVGTAARPPAETRSDPDAPATPQTGAGFAWEPAPCAEVALQRLDQPESEMYRVERPGYTMIVVAALPADTVCSFAGRFLTDLEFFAASDPEPLAALASTTSAWPARSPEYPAVLPLAR